MYAFENCALNLIVLICVLFGLFYKYFTLHFNYWKQRGVPCEEPKFFFGSIKENMRMRSSIGSIYKKLYEKFPNEKLVGAYKSRKPDLIVKDLELIKHVLVKDFQYFPDRMTDLSEEVEPLNMNLFNTGSLKWKSLRQKSTPIFTSGKLKNMFHLIIEKANEFEEYATTSIKNKNEVEFRDLMSKFTIEVIGSCAFGVKMNTMLDENAPFRKMGRKVFETSIPKTIKLFLRLLLPSIFNFCKIRIHDYEIEEFFVSTVKDMIREREASQIKRHDFIDLLLEVRKNLSDEKESGKKDISQLCEKDFTDVFITAQVFIFFLAGFETSSTLMAFTLNELAFHPEIQQKVLNEIDVILKKYDGKLTYEGISEMKYLEMVVCETQRKYPALGTLTRVCNSSYTFPGTDVTIENGVNVSIPLLAIHYDPEYYPEPKKFIPERFSPENKGSRHPMKFMPFGEGPRNCIGLRFGKIQSMVGLISFLRKFTVEPTKKSEKQIEIDPNAFVTAPRNGVWLKMNTRNLQK